MHLGFWGLGVLGSAGFGSFALVAPDVVEASGAASPSGSTFAPVAAEALGSEGFGSFALVAPDCIFLVGWEKYIKVELKRERERERSLLFFIPEPFF